MDVFAKTDFFEALFRAAMGIILALLINGVLSGTIIYLVYFVLTLPMRRRERARLFLDLIEMGLKRGQSPEVLIPTLAASRETSLGIRFHLLAAYVEQGLKLTQALGKVPRMLTPQLRAVLQIGERIGDIRKVLPACRHLVRDSISSVRGAMNYLVLLLFVATPFSVFVSTMLRVKIMPTLNEVIYATTNGGHPPRFTQFVFAANGWFVLIQILILLCLWTALVLYIGGPQLGGRIATAFPGLELVSPWRKRQLQRDFSAMLAVLLDAGVPEIDAVRMAGTSTASPALIRRSEQVVARLSAGAKLPEALQVVESTGELQWRVANALRRGRGFLEALAGWHDALDAKAFQLEQTAAQITTTGLVLLNGVIVGAILMAVFAGLIHILNEVALW